MSRLLERVVLLLLEEEKEKKVMAAIEKVKPDLEKMSKAELELLSLKIDQMVKEIGKKALDR